MFYGVTGMDMRKLAFDFADGIIFSIHLITKRKWLVYFMKPRNLCLRTPEATNMTRVAGFTRPEVMRFFEIYKRVRDKYNYRRADIQY
jgi:hypothetical protein